jgi:hypothetical protein
MKTFLFAAAGLALLATPALAKRHCVGADGNEIADATTKKDCKAKGGKWRKVKHAAENKDAAAAEKPAADKPADKPAGEGEGK